MSMSVFPLEYDSTPILLCVHVVTVFPTIWLRCVNNLPDSGTWVHIDRRSSWIVKLSHIRDPYFRFPEFLKFKTSWVPFNHLQRRSAMAEGASAGLMQQSGQDLASWKHFSYIYCPRGRKSWLRGTYQADRVNEDILLEVNISEGGQHRLHNGKT